MHSKLFVANTRILFISAAMDTTFHRHHAAQICIGLEAPFTLQLNKSLPNILQLDAAIIAADTEHMLCANNTPTASLFIEKEGEEYAQILQQASLAAGESVLPLTISSELREQLLSCYQSTQDTQTLSRLCVQLLAEFSGGKKTLYQPDPRIKTVLQALDQCGNSQVSVDSLAELVHLSSSRLIHLFTSEVGIPIRRYSLWRRIRLGMEYAIKEKHSLTEAAYAAGFSDSAHFSKVFKEMFGVPPSLLTDKKAPLEVLFDET
jgi:AraC-like DNA-binding protein